MRYLILFLFTILSIQLSFAEIINVPDDFETIQGAIDASEDGDTVLVEPGEYVENINFDGKEIAVIGNPDDPSEVIIDGDSSGAVVTFENGENLESVLLGFTIQNGYVERNGGGIRISESSPSIIGCIIQNNLVGTRGGGISCEPNSNPVISNCIITTNESGSGGGGIWCGEGSSPRISDCDINRNSAGWNGAGINMYIDCDPIITNCLIYANTADHKGGGIIVSQDCSPVISNCKILYNESGDNGGGITIERGAAPIIRCCLISGNRTLGDGGIIAALENCSPIIINCTMNMNQFREGSGALFCSASHLVMLNSIFYYNNGFVMSPSILFDPDSAASSITIAYSDLEDGQEGINTNDNGEVHWGEGNINEPPQFVDFDPFEDINLSENSPCVDVGTAFFVWEDDTLLNLSEDEYHSFAPDMGAFESEYVNNVEDAAYLVNEFRLYSAFPNPFNSTSTIEYALPFASKVTLNLYNLAGMRIEKIVDGRLQAGVYRATLNAGDLASGLYFVKLEGSGQSFTRKLMLVK